MNARVYRARWLLPIASPPRENGWIEVIDDRIGSMGHGRSPSHAIDLGDVALLPALVNAHTHLEFSRLPQPLGQPGPSFSAWIEAVLAWRRSKSPDVWAQEKPLAIATGIEESARAGIGLVGEIASPPWQAPWYEQNSLSITVFHELIGRAPDRAGQAHTTLQEHVARWNEASHSSDLAWGISPHAPYTWSVPETLQAARQAAQLQVPLAMHLAESAEEDLWLQTGSGPLAEMLDRVAPNASRTSSDSGNSYRAYLEALSAAPRVALIHANYLRTVDWDWLTPRRDQFIVVHCPRTHARFGHEQSPLDEVLRRDLPIALGTDSRASNPDLSIWNEARFLAQMRAGVPAERWLRSITIDAARALGRERSFGSFQIEMPFHPCVIPLASDAPAEPSVEYLLKSNATTPLPWPPRPHAPYFQA